MPYPDVAGILHPLESTDREAFVRMCSPFCSELLDRHPEWLPAETARESKSAPELLRLAGARDLNSVLRDFRNHQMLDIIWRDLCGLATLEDTFARLTGLAETCCETALLEHERRLADRHGLPRDTEGRHIRLCVLAMGKLGGGELNLSSDIDLMFFYPQGGQCDGPRALSAEQFFLRQARALISTLSDITEDGFCFRVDARLRPFGDSGPLVCSHAAMMQYYQREGRDWERYALIKARPVAGDLDAGYSLLSELNPFVYRRYIDFGAVEALQDMHASVQDDARRREQLDDIKRGPGGIREIEFLVQCFQLLRGGREQGLQTPSLLAALNEIERLELMGSATVEELLGNYAWLRVLENRIQAIHDRQQHRLPRDADLERVTRAMRFESPERLAGRLASIRESVSQRFAGIFPSAPKPAGGEHQQWADAWRRQQLEPHQNESVPASPQQAFLRRIQRLSISERARRRLDRFMPLLLQRLATRENEPQLLNRVYDLLGAICQRSSYLALLEQQPIALDRVLDLFGRSEWIASRVIRFPALLDELIDPALGLQIPDAAELKDSVTRLIGAATDHERALAELNYLKRATSLRVAVAQLQQGLDQADVHSALGALADALLQGVFDLASNAIAVRHGLPGNSADGARLAIIAYGTLGAKELAYDSDLDLVFLFDATAGQSNGARPLEAETYHTRLARRILSWLTAITSAGRLYEVDTRLRPNGRAGALVSSLPAYETYQKQQAWTWELQALIRARPVAGCRSIGGDFRRIRREVLCAPRDPDRLREELNEMRGRMATTQPQGNEKYRPGGLVDIEFICQFGVLSLASDHPELLDSGNSFRSATRPEHAGLDQRG